MNANATAALPGMGDAAEAAIARCRALCRAPVHKVDRGALLWNLLNAYERRYMLRIARIEVARAELLWRDFSDAERDAVLVAWARLRDWVYRIDQHLQKVAA